MMRLHKFALTFAAAFGLLFALVSFTVSIALGSPSWRDVSIGFAVGIMCGTAIVLHKLPALIRDELQRVYVALMQEWIAAVMKQCAEQGVELDIAPLHLPVLDATQTKLQSTTFHTIDLADELRA